MNSLTTYINRLADFTRTFDIHVAFDDHQVHLTTREEVRSLSGKPIAAAILVPSNNKYYGYWPDCDGVSFVRDGFLSAADCLAAALQAFRRK